MRVEISRLLRQQMQRESIEQNGEKRTQSVIYVLKEAKCRVQFHHHQEILKV